ncbi:MAG: (Fe-S)-binding protein [Candidatus Heimdallarchaeota archaeon]|nr:(Fe-S)-binding protein [Candidatus Heimdallarchaeota archaeon]MBY8994423.1 (Fe-S)-binding protein [Candidatus Heimdallarchaeota archaeon]
MDLEETKKHLEEIYTCNRTRCGFCIQKCPVYEVTELETYSSRGRNLVARGIIEGKVEVDEEVLKLANTCLLCGYCEKNCALDNTQIFRDFKADLVESGMTDQYLEGGVDSVDKYGNPFKKSPESREIPELKSNPKSKVLLYGGCVYSISQQETLKLIAELLGDYKYLGKDEPCCMNILWDSGHKKDFKKKMKDVAKVLNDANADELVTGCPTCFRTYVDEYGEILKPKPIHFITKLHQMVKSGKLKFESKDKIKVTWHDPCHLGRFGGIIDEPREIIKSVKNIEFVEMENSGLDSHCCGAGSGMLMSYPEIAIEISKKRYREAESAGAEIILTFCPTCELTLGRGADTIARDEMDFDADDFDFDAEPEPKIKVLNLLEWLVTLKK